MWRPQGFMGLELSEVVLENRAFPKSLIFNYVFGVRLAGMRKTTYRGETFTTGESFSVYQPGEVLGSKPDTEGVWHYQNLSVTPDYLQRYLADALGEAIPAPNFPRMVTEGARDDLLRAAFGAAFQGLTEGAEALAQEVALLRFLGLSVHYLADTSLETPRVSREPHAVDIVQNALADGLAKRLTLDDLATLAGLSKWHLLRVFKREVGVSPDVYRMCLRVEEAKRLLRSGHTLRRVAAETGFHDRSHFRRTFKRYALVTPSVYQKGAR